MTSRNRLINHILHNGNAKPTEGISTPRWNAIVKHIRREEILMENDLGYVTEHSKHRFTFSAMTQGKDECSPILFGCYWEAWEAMVRCVNKLNNQPRRRVYHGQV